MRNLKQSKKSRKSWKTCLIVLAVTASMSSLIACSRAVPVSYFTGQDYLTLTKGQTYVAPRDMVLATESVIQEKDQQIIDLQEAVSELEHRLLEKQQ